MEAQELVLVPGQPFDGPLAIDAAGLREQTERRFDLLPGLRHPDVLKVGPGPVVQGFRHRPGDVGRLVHPAAAVRLLQRPCLEKKSYAALVQTR